MASPLTTPPSPEREESQELWRWVGPLAALLIFGAVVVVLHHQFAHLHVKHVIAHLHAIPRQQILTALGFTAASYWLLTTYELLAFIYLRRKMPYGEHHECAADGQC